MRKLFGALALIVASALFVFAEDTPAEPSGLSVLTIGEIRVTRGNVFPQKEGEKLHFPYSFANTIHVVTTADFIHNDLTFKEGDVFDPAVLEESERILRARSIFRYVKVEALPAHDGRVDVLIQTDDVWTTNLRSAYGSAGGQDFYTLGVLENNFLGEGKVVSAFIDQGIDRFTRGAAYKDRQLFGSRWELQAGYGKDEKGREWESTVQRPFYSPRVSFSEGFHVHINDDEDRLFENGDEVVKFAHKTRNYRAFGAWAPHPQPDRARRVTFAFDSQEDTFADIRFETVPPPLADRRVAALLFGFDFQNRAFEKRRGVTTFDRDEDINLGFEWLVEAGPSLERLGATRDGALGHFQASKVLAFGESQLWFNRIDFDGRYEADALHDGIMRVRSEYFWPEWREKNTASLRGEWVASHNLDPESQFLLGGESGLRGYSVRQFSGEHSALVTLENRRVVWYDWLQLVNVGWAVFADAGSVWKRHAAFERSGIASDVGAGIRFAPSRSVDPGLIRIDFAYALQDNQRTSPLVLSIGADIEFGDRTLRKFDQ